MPGQRRWATSAAGLAVIAAVLLGTAGVLVILPMLPDRRPVYVAVSNGFCEQLPFELFEEQIGPARRPFGVYDSDYGSTESVGIVRTLDTSCEVFTQPPAPDHTVSDVIFVQVETFATAKEARDAFADDRRRWRPELVDVALPCLDDVVDDWWVYQYPLEPDLVLDDRTITMLDRNVVARVEYLFDPKAVSEPDLRTATARFIEALWAHLRTNTRDAPEPAPRVVARAAYRTLGASLSGDLRMDALEERLGPRRDGGATDFHSEDLTMIGSTVESVGGQMALHIKYFDGAQAAMDFFAAHFSHAPPPFPAAGPMREVDAVSWEYRPPSGRHDGWYNVAAVDNNALILLAVGSYNDNDEPVIDTELAPAVAEALDATLTLVRT